MAQPTPLKRAIFESGSTQRAVALQIGVREDHFSRIVNGLRTTIVIEAKIASALGRPVADLFPGHDSVIGRTSEKTQDVHDDLDAVATPGARRKLSLT